PSLFIVPHSVRWNGIGVLIEHFAGDFPLWLAPVQCVLLPITDGQIEYAKTIADRLRAKSIRVELDDRNEKIGYKIRDWETKKIPYMLVVGEKEKANNTVALRQHKKGDVGAVPVETVIENLVKEISQKTITIEEKNN
ncbi:MAG TPA: His/Gly/Thr/Pro-type tRNA ligase C-terminal domain-containing protein, partial [Bacteroidota bacterium]|nr:His/Gly/Thr/Pro-type tRNA ligase C-terminal domain-containing protein [Bacteroidota bacterium]